MPKIYSNKPTFSREKCAAMVGFGWWEENKLSGIVYRNKGQNERQWGRPRCFFVGIKCWGMDIREGGVDTGEKKKKYKEGTKILSEFAYVKKKVWVSSRAPTRHQCRPASKVQSHVGAHTQGFAAKNHNNFTFLFSNPCVCQTFVVPLQHESKMDRVGGWIAGTCGP